MVITTPSAQQTRNFGKKIAMQLGGGEVVCLYGELGAGKTTFVSGIINEFLPGKRVLSPTFIIVRHYDIPKGTIKHIFHIDLYRMNTISEIEQIGIGEFMHRSDTVTLIEWPERMQSILPRKRLDIYFQTINSKIRKISLIPNE